MLLSSCRKYPGTDVYLIVFPSASGHAARAAGARARRAESVRPFILPEVVDGMRKIREE